MGGCFLSIYYLFIIMLIMFQKCLSWLVVYFGLFFKEYDLMSGIRLLF